MTSIKSIKNIFTIMISVSHIALNFLVCFAEDIPQLKLILIYPRDSKNFLPPTRLNILPLPLPSPQE